MISIIIVNFNGENIIGQCLASLKKQHYDNYEVIVVDNDSKDASVSIIMQDFPWVKLIVLESNLGFTGGNIEGLKHANGELICLLNPDTEVHIEWLNNLVAATQRYPDVGIFASKLLVYGSDKIDSAGDGFIVPGKGYKRGEGESNLNYNREECVFGACGGAMLIRKAVIDDIGFLDDDFFLIYEDTDYNIRAQLAGWKCMFIPDAVVYHKVRSSIGEKSDIAVYYAVRNSHYLLIGNIPFWMLVLWSPLQLIYEIASFFYFVGRLGKWSPYFRAKRDFILALPMLMRKRRELAAIRRITDMQFVRLMTPVWNKEFIKGKLAKFFGNGL